MSHDVATYIWKKYFSRNVLVELRKRAEIANMLKTKTLSWLVLLDVNLCKLYRAIHSGRSVSEKAEGFMNCLDVSPREYNKYKNHVANELDSGEFKVYDFLKNHYKIL
jgi:hypothetical protein